MSGHETKNLVSGFSDYAMSFKEEFNLMDYMRISSKSGENVAKAFDILTTRILEKQNY